MTDEEDKDTMLGNIEASNGCLKTKASHLNSQGSGNIMEDFPGIKDNINIHPADFLDSDRSVKNQGFEHTDQGYSRPFYEQESYRCPIFYPNAQILQQSHLNMFDYQFYPMMIRECVCPVENRLHCIPYKMVLQGFAPDFQFQEFQYFVVIDFEATCDKDKTPHPQEIIEFPSVLVNSLTGQLEASFQTYVRPAYHQLLSDFCKELTGIQQIQVDRGVSLSEALLMHDKWLDEKGIKHTNFAVVTWSNWDCRVMLESECRLKGIRKPPYFNK